MTSSVPAIVVAGGISGLACAYALRKAGVDAQVLETSRVPEAYWPEVRDGFLLELALRALAARRAAIAVHGTGIADQLSAPAARRNNVLMTVPWSRAA